MVTSTAPSHYLSQSWPRSLTSYGVTRPQWAKDPLTTTDLKTFSFKWRISIKITSSVNLLVWDHFPLKIPFSRSQMSASVKPWYLPSMTVRQFPPTVSQQFYYSENYTIDLTMPSFSLSYRATPRNPQDWQIAPRLACPLELCFNILTHWPPKQNGRFIAYNIFNCNFFNENLRIWFQISLKCVPMGTINYKSALV